MIMNYSGLERPDSRIARGGQLTGQRPHAKVDNASSCQEAHDSVNQRIARAMGGEVTGRCKPVSNSMGERIRKQPCLRIRSSFSMTGRPFVAGMQHSAIAAYHPALRGAVARCPL